MIVDPTAGRITQTWCPVTKAGDEFRVEVNDDTVITRHIWDRHNIVEERSSSNVVQAEYTYQPQPYGDLISQRRSGASHFYHFDAQGSALALPKSFAPSFSWGPNWSKGA